MARAKNKSKSVSSSNSKSTNAVASKDEDKSTDDSRSGKHSKKRTRDEILVDEEDTSSRSNKDSAEKKKKKKRKKKSKKETSEDGNDSESEQADASPTLEGAMVDDQMVLVDRSTGKVYSSTDQLENGDRKEIGSVGKNGVAILLEDKTSGTCRESSSALVFPFETDADDHCESPLLAYQDILPFLKACSNKPSSKLSVYDPYYCNGTVARHLESLGFPNVYNRKEDCYQVWADSQQSKSKSKYPSHDVLVTNPPYSADHIEKLVDHITSPAFGNRPWMLLLPQWVHKKDYFVAKTKHLRPFYLVPHKRYVYVPPPSFRESKKSDVHKKSSPFVSMWYIWGGTLEQNETWLNLASRRNTTCDVARSKSALRDLRRKGTQRK